MLINKIKLVWNQWIFIENNRISCFNKVTLIIEVYTRNIYYEMYNKSAIKIVFNLRHTMLWKQQMGTSPLICLFEFKRSLWHLRCLVVIVKWILWMISPPVESIEIVIIYLLEEQNITHTVCAMQYTHMRSSTKRIFLFSPSIAFMSSSEREKSNICNVKNTQLCITFHNILPVSQNVVFQALPSMQNCWCKQTWKFSFMRTGLKLFGMTTTPLCTLNLKATWAVVLLYFLAVDTSSSSSSNGGHFKFTLSTWLVFYYDTENNLLPPL